MQKHKFYTLLLAIFSWQSLLAFELQIGDVLLLDLDCYSCQRIEDETFGPYSHSGVVVSTGSEVRVAQSLKNVHDLELSKFLAMSSKPVLVLRSVEAIDIPMLFVSYQNMRGIDFDHDFLWDNNTLYCSEFIYKLLKQSTTLSDLKPAPMNFTRNWDFWKIYFKKTPPQGKLGLSPNDFYRSTDFEIIGEL